MTFLELVEKLRTRTDSGGGQLSDVVNLTGPAGRLVGYVAEAWRQLQSSRRDWLFRMGEFSLTLAAGSSDYDISAAIAGGEVRQVGGVFALATVSQPNSKRRLQALTYPYFQQLYAARATPTGLPTEFCTLPDGNTARFNAALVEGCTFSGPYYKAAQTLTAKTDVPNIPVEFHDAIFWLALKKWAQYEDAPEALREATMEAARWETTLVNELAPRILVGSQPMA